MTRLLKYLVLVPLAVICLAFAVANRHLVTVSFDPFDGNDVASPQITAPLFFVLFVVLIVGVVLGGVAHWLAQGGKRRAAREARADAERWKAEAERWKTESARLKAQFAPEQSALLPHNVS